MINLDPSVQMQTTSKQGLSEADVTGLRLLEAVSIDASKKGNLVTDKKLIRDLDEFAAAIRKKRGLATTSPSREKATRWKEDARATMYRSQNRSNIKTDEKKKRRVLGVKMEERYRESKSELWKAGSLESNVEDTRTESVGATMSHKNDTTETTDLNNPRDLYELTLTLCEGLANSDERLKSSIRSKRRQTKLDEWLGVSRGTNYDEASLADITEGRLESRGKDGPEVLNIEEDNKFNQSGVLKPSESQDLDEGEYLLHDGLISQILDMRNLKASNEVQIIDKESELGISEVLNLESRSEVMETRPIVLKEVDIDIEKLAADKDLDFGIPEILNLQTSSEVKETREKGTFDDERSLKEVDIDIDFDLGIPEILNLQASSEVTETEKGTVDNGRSLKETELDIDFDLGISEILNLQTSSEVMETRHIEKREADRDLDLGIPEILNLQARSEVKETTIVEKGTVDNGTSLNEVDIDIAKLETKKELAGMSESLDSKASNEVGTSPKGIVSEEMLKIPVQKLNKLPLRERRNERIKNRRIMVVIQNGRWKIRAGIVGKCPSPPLVVAPALIHQNSEMNSDEEMDAVRSSWEKAFTKMDVDPLDCHALITYKATATTTDRESLVELAFSCFDIAGLYLISDVQACLLSSGKSTGLVIDIGEYQTTIVPVYENLVVSMKPICVSCLSVSSCNMPWFPWT